VLCIAPLSIAATLFKIDTKALRAVAAKEAEQKAQKKAEKTVGTSKMENKSKRTRK
jgi:hypothetical protein